MSIQHYHQNTRIGWQYTDQNILIPTASGKVSGWLRLAASEQAAGEWTPSIVDVLNAGNPVTQTDTDRRAAVGVTSNGLPTMVFDGSDVHVWPLDNAINNMATKIGFWWWYKPISVTGVQRQLTIGIATGGASAEKLQIYANDATLRAEIYVTNTLGRTLTTGNVLTAGAWHAIYFSYDSSLGGDDNCEFHVNKTLATDVHGAIGLGDDNDLTVLPQPTGNCTIGGLHNLDAPLQGIADGGELGPNLLVFRDTLNTFEINNIYDFERPV